MTDTRFFHCILIEDLEALEDYLALLEDQQGNDLDERYEEPDDDDDWDLAWEPDYLETIWETALEKFPHELTSTGYTNTEGNPLDESDLDEISMYSEEFEFVLGTLADREIMGGGWITLRYDPRIDEVPMIYGEFRAAFDGDWSDRSAQLLGDYGILVTEYAIEDEQWSDLMSSTM